ncbi:hypothetical protein L1987_62004 [Smallanthus sonchifolius]|uniref:Uncharacterized protein n=1 Tax=Smallanthus sonchifolius TaxID=185202 RepID=A0ACB9C976_9ASTR|nr:hypothetical protein L1987_62004 [Smallanthus sonchifolius]
MVSGLLTATMPKSSGMLRLARSRAVGILMMIFFKTTKLTHHLPPSKLVHAVGAKCLPDLDVRVISYGISNEHLYFHLTLCLNSSCIKDHCDLSQNSGKGNVSVSCTLVLNNESVFGKKINQLSVGKSSISSKDPTVWITIL